MHTIMRWSVLAVGLSAWMQFGCSNGGNAGHAPHAAASASVGTRAEDDRGAIAASLAELSPADRAAAEAQRLCPVSDEPLGSMGVPLRANVRGTPVFVCCKGCLAKAVAHPDATLAKVAESKTRAAGTP